MSMAIRTSWNHRQQSLLIFLCHPLANEHQAQARCPPPTSTSVVSIIMHLHGSLLNISGSPLNTGVTYYSENRCTYVCMYVAIRRPHAYDACAYGTGAVRTCSSSLLSTHAMYEAKRDREEKVRSKPSQSQDWSSYCNNNLHKLWRLCFK